ncbi:unnamed protein product, partial [Ectocarpus sp. 12 AP-2014]
MVSVLFFSRAVFFLCVGLLQQLHPCGQDDQADRADTAILPGSLEAGLGRRRCAGSILARSPDKNPRQRYPGGLVRGCVEVFPGTVGERRG